MSEKKDVLKDSCDSKISVVNDVDKTVEATTGDIGGTERTDEINADTSTTIVVDVETLQIAENLQEQCSNNSDDSISTTSTNTQISQISNLSAKRAEITYKSVVCQKNVDTENSENSKTGEDEPDALKLKNIKKLFTCASGKTTSLDEDYTQYGFGEPQNRQETNEKTVENYGFKETKSEIPTDETFTTIPFDNNMVKPIKPSPVEESPDKSGPDRYDFSYRKRGYMVIIVNDQFIRSSSREGAHFDLQKMQEFARKFEFQIFNHGEDKNVTREGTLRILKRVQQTDHSQCDCFAFMISSHGKEEYNLRAGGNTDFAITCSDDQIIFISRILEMFNDTNCPTLKDKPKFFIVQACRGESIDHGCDLSVIPPGRPIHNTCGDSFDEVDTRPGNDSWASQHTPGPISAISESVLRYPSQYINTVYVPAISYAVCETPSLKCGNDMLILYAIPPGMFAWRNESTGSWMIDCFYRVMMAYNMSKPKSFLSLLTRVSSQMSERQTNTPYSQKYHKKKAISVIEHALTKDVYFQPKEEQDTVRETYI